MASGLSIIYLSYVAHTSSMWTNSKNRKRTRIVVGTCDTNRTRKATEIFPTGYLCSQARERIPLGEQTRTDLRWPKANRVVGSERWDLYFIRLPGPTDKICKACHTSKKGVCFAGGPYLTHLCVTGDLTSRAYQVWRVRVHNTLDRW